MDEIEIDIADAIVGEIDEGDDATAPAPAGCAPMHGGSDTIDSLNYAPDSEPMTAGLSRATTWWFRYTADGRWLQRPG